MFDDRTIAMASGRYMETVGQSAVSWLLVILPRVTTDVSSRQGGWVRYVSN